MDQWPSGTQFEIVHGEQHAVIVEVGGGIRAYDVGGVDVLQPYAVDQMCDGAHGAPLIPWPNRLGDGRYSFDGNDYQVALTEPEKQNAIHGFLRWRPWSCQENREDRLVMTTTLFPLEGYPFTLDVQVSYRLDETGLSVTTTATNLGDQPAPYACGQHPYLSAGGGQSRRGHPAISSEHPHPDRPPTPASHRPRGRRRNGLRLPRRQEDRLPRHR